MDCYFQSLEFKIWDSKVETEGWAQSQVQVEVQSLKLMLTLDFLPKLGKERAIVVKQND